MKKQFLFSAALAICSLSACAQSKKVSRPDPPLSSLEMREKNRVERNELFIKEKGVPREKKDANGTLMYLHHVDDNGKPIYYKSYSNLKQGQNVKSARLWQGGGLGLNLQGQNMEVSASRARLGMWEPGATRTMHAELGGRAVTRDLPVFTPPMETQTMQHMLPAP